MIRVDQIAIGRCGEAAAQILTRSVLKVKVVIAANVEAKSASVAIAFHALKDVVDSFVLHTARESNSSLV